MEWPAGPAAPARTHPPEPRLLPWVLPALLLVGAADVLGSGRNLAESFQALEQASTPGRPASVDWLQRGVSLLLLAGAAEQIVHHLRTGQRAPHAGLLAAFVAYWFGTVGLPALWGTHPQIRHDLLYAPALGIACCLAGAAVQARVLTHSRDTLMLLMLAGLGAALWQPARVLDLSYQAGFLPGVPRFAGLTAHPVTQGLLAQVAVVLLWMCPYAGRVRQWTAWTLAWTVLLLAQSKTAWLACALSLLAVVAVQRGPRGWHQLSDPRRTGLALVLLASVIVLTVTLAGALLSPTVTEQVARFWASEQGEQLMSLTGRDRIWEVAYEEWQRQPIFGYGLSLWDAAYRAAIGLPHATHAHNQWLDDAARAGSVGVAALVLYAGVLTAACVRSARASRGLSLALGLTLALRAVGEVPLSLIGYGPELFTHLLLVTTLAAAPIGGRVLAPLSHPRPAPLLP